jgi:hypothetical protein
MCDLCNRLRHNERKGTSAMLAALQAERERLEKALVHAQDDATYDRAIATTLRERLAATEERARVAEQDNGTLRNLVDINHRYIEAVAFNATGKKRDNYAEAARLITQALQTMDARNETTQSKDGD